MAAGVFLVGVLAVTCFCKRGRQAEYGGHGFLGKKYKMAAEKPLAFHHKKPTAVKSPAGNTHYLKKSPSPTEGKSPPGVSENIRKPTENKYFKVEMLRTKIRNFLRKFSIATLITTSSKFLIPKRKLSVNSGHQLGSYRYLHL